MEFIIFGKINKFMRKIIIALIISWSLNFYAQESSLKFNKKFYECEQQWVTLQKEEKDSTYVLGLIYFDPFKGYVFNYINDFKIENNIYIPVKEEITANYIIVINNVNQMFSVISKERYKELKIEKYDEIFNIYGFDKNNANDLVKRGNHLNHVGASDVAITYLEDAQKIDSKAESLLFELGYAYNATQQYEKAIKLLHIGISKHEKDNWLLYKELIFALVFNKQLKEAEESFKNGLKLKEKSNVAESSYNIAYGYFLEKNSKKFNEWVSITRQHSESNSQFMKNLEMMKNDLSK